MDLVALGRFALMPDDDLNLAALLRSPLVGFSEVELYVLAVDRDGTLWRALRSRNEETPSFSFAFELLADARRRADFEPPFEYYSHALGPRQGRKRLLARLGSEANDAIDEFLSLALSYERLNTPSLQGFLHWFESGDAEIRRDMQRGHNEVRVMTVHGAKGLEADIVILPDTTTLPESAARHAALLYDGDAVFFPLADGDSPDCVRDAKAKADDESLREHRRLLYVALTRAKDELHICGFAGKRGVRPGSWYEMMRPIAEARGILVGEDEGITRPHVAAPSALEIPAPAPVVLPAWASEPVRQEHARPRLLRPSEALGLPESTGLPPRDGAKRFDRGRLVHTLLARLPALLHEDRVRAARRYLGLYHVEDGECEELIEETLAIFDHPEFARAFAAGSRAEVPIVAELPELGTEVRVSGRLDRLAITDDDVLVVDYKSNRPAAAKLGDVAPLYLAQMAMYRAALGKIFPEKPIECALVWTEGPTLMVLPGALLDAELERIRVRLDPKGSGS
jgi:ATP-dependent helicase/nuclease subunit A